MLSLNVVKCIIQWRKQLIFNYMLTTQFRPQQHQAPALRKFKQMPFIWESQNYLLKLKSDNQFLLTSPFSHYFDFSPKSDPFLVTPAVKQPQKKRKTVLPI